MDDKDLCEFNNFYKKDDIKNSIESFINENEDYIINYDKNDMEHKKEFLLRVSAYNWLNENKEYINSVEDLENKLHITEYVLNLIKDITYSTNGLLKIKLDIMKLLKETKIKEKELYIDFDIIFCLDVDDIKFKIRHTERYLNLLKKNFLLNEKESQVYRSR